MKIIRSEDVLRLAQTSVAQESNIDVGDACIVAHVNGGWALPGGASTRDPEKAQDAANSIAEYIKTHGGRSRAMRPPERPGR